MIKQDTFCIHFSCTLYSNWTKFQLCCTLLSLRGLIFKWVFPPRHCAYFRDLEHVATDCMSRTSGLLISQFAIFETNIDYMLSLYSLLWRKQGKGSASIKKIGFNRSKMYNIHILSLHTGMPCWQTSKHVFLM